LPATTIPARETPVKSPPSLEGPTISETPAPVIEETPAEVELPAEAITTPPAEIMPTEKPEQPTVEGEVFGDGTVEADAPQGAQKPQLTIEKQSPPEAILGKPFIYSIIVKNVGSSPAGRVVVEDEIPRGAKLTGTIPQAELIEKTLKWKLGTLQPGQQQKISVRVIPVAEGAIGSVATVNFVAEVAAQTLVNKPELKLEVNAPQEASLGKPVVFQFKIVNTGKATARGVILRDVLPDHLQHPGGKDLEYEIGDLPAGQFRDVQLTLTAGQVGEAVNQAIVTAGGEVAAQTKASVEIIDQGVTVSCRGPKVQLLGRSASYTSTIRNKSNAPMIDIVVVEQIPAGMQFVKASQGGVHDPNRRTVTWRIPQIAGKATEDVSVMLLPQAPGAQESSIRVYGREGELASSSIDMSVKGFAKLGIEITTAEAPIQIGERISCRVKIHNSGTETATGVMLSVLPPDEMTIVNVKGPVKYEQDGAQINFAKIDSIGPEEQVTVDLLLEAAVPGDTRLQVQIQSDQMQRPLNREAATLIFSTQE